MELTVFAPYGSVGASTRVRVLDWLDHTGRSANLHLYAGLKDNTPKNVLRHAGRVAMAEWWTRRHAGDLRGRVLIHREVTPFTSGAVSERVATRASNSIYDFDDGLHVDAAVGTAETVVPERGLQTNGRKRRSSRRGQRATR